MPPAVACALRHGCYRLACNARSAPAKRMTKPCRWSWTAAASITGGPTGWQIMLDGCPRGARR
eukprot:5539515-Lingulodinium_polyedra.AAC.1